LELASRISSRSDGDRGRRLPGVPVLVLLGPALLLIALMLFIASAIERRRAGPDAD
jgi:hypothetical protein